jgi:DNA (cytosine-5)-methyltransferase 1
MEVRIGNIFGFSGGNYAGNVYDKDFLAPTLNTMQGGCKQPMIIANINPSGNGINGAVHTVDAEAPTITTNKGEGNKIIVAMRGRNPDNPSDRTVGSPTEQRLEPNRQVLCNTLTSVQKDNLVMETVHIKQATSQGYIECEVGGVADLSFPDSNTRRGRVQDGGRISPTLMAGETDICRIEQYRIRKLTPRECWRLMDFKDEDFDKAAQVNSNTQLYKQAGNSIIRNVLVAILGQLIEGKEDAYRKL